MTINGKQLSDSIRASLAAEVAEFPARYGRAPKLAVVLVGDDQASARYVRNKTVACEQVGIENLTVTLPGSTSEEELLRQIGLLNADPGVDGILLQLPLPRHISDDKVISAIAREKDVDGFHPLNVARLWTGRSEDGFCVACTPSGVMRLLKAAGVRIEGAHAVVLGRSNIVGLPVAKLLLNANATVTICHSRTADLPSLTRQADILVAAIGRPKFVGAEMVKEGAAVIDVGIDTDPVTGKLCGDVDFASVEPKASVITPVPGGVGPMTICMLMQNTVDCFLRGRK